MGDTFLITNNKLLVECGDRLQETININGETIKRFLVSTDFTPKSSIKRHYTHADLCDTDIKCSSNKIGEIINLAQMLNSVYWDKKHNKANEKELLELYKDISNLNILSCIEIDRAKKISPVDAKKELDKIRRKHSLGKDKISRNKEKITVGIRPKFFKYLDGGKDYKFKKFDTGMDYLNEVIDKRVVRVKTNTSTIPLKDILVKVKVEKCDRKLVQKLKKKIEKCNSEIRKLYINNYDNKYEAQMELREALLDDIRIHNITYEVIYWIITRINKGYTDEKYQDYKKIGLQFLTILYNIDKKKFLSLFKIREKANEYIIKDNDGGINLYQVSFKKHKK